MTLETFDEFRHHYEVFSKIDTPEKLSACEKQYKSYIKMLESQEFFEPLTQETNELDHSSIYEKNLRSIFNFNQIKKNQILFLIQPAFEPESLLSIEGSKDVFTLNYGALEKNYWYIFYDDHTIATQKVTHSKGYLKPSIGNQILDVVEQSIKEARKDESGRFVMDGISYSLSKIVGDQRVDVCKHSPDDNSKTGRIVQLLKTVVEHVKTTNENSEEKIADFLRSVLDKK